MIRFISRLIKLALLSAVVAGAVYLGTDAFSRKWREFIIAQVAAHGLHLDFEGLTLNPFGGMVAREVRIFNGQKRERVLATVDRLNLDFDLGKLLENKVSIEELELSHANLSLPVDPQAADQTVIELKDLSARAFLSDGRLEVRQAEGTLSGIKLSILGDLVLAPGKTDETTKPKPPSAMEGLQMLRDQKGRIQKGLDWLKRFEFASAPRISLEVHAVAERPLETSARLFFEAQALNYQGYVCNELLAEAEFNAGIIDLTRLHLKDRTGEVNASATWRLNADDLRFRLTSSADLPHLAQTFLNSDNLREIVFYEPPHLALEGIWHVGGPLAQHKRPVHVTGRLECGRFSTRGAMFDGLSANIGVAPEGVYVRDALLQHSTGTLSAQALVHETQGCRYRIVLRMDPNAFLPFARQEQTRQIIRHFQFTPKSGIFLELEGSGPELDPQACLNRGRGVLDNFVYRGVPVVSLSADVEFQGPWQHYSNVKIRRTEGRAEAARVDVDHEQDWVKLKGVKTKLDTVAIISCFASNVAQSVSKYRFHNTNSVEMDGTIFWKAGEKNDFRVKFRDPEGSAHYEMLGEDYVINAPVGDLIFKGSQMSFDIGGKVFGDPMVAKGKVDLSPSSGDFSVLLKAEKFSYPVFKKQVPFTSLTADVAQKSNTTAYDVRAGLLGGKFSLKGTLSDKKQPASYQGEMRVENVSFERFAQIYSQSNDTEGDLTGHFKFAGNLNDRNSLKGTGVGIILNGNLYSVPILGPLTPMLGAILPAKIKGYNIAKEANCTFEVADGYVMTHDFEALTSTFRILLDGRIDFIRDDLDMTAQVRVRGLPGIVFLPFSELLEYRAEGSTMTPKWTSNLLKGQNPKAGGRPPPAEASIRAAEQVGGEPPKAPIAEPRRPPSPVFNRR